MKKTYQRMWILHMAFVINYFSGYPGTMCGQGLLSTPPLLHPPEHQMKNVDVISNYSMDENSNIVNWEFIRNRFQFAEKPNQTLAIQNSERRYAEIPVLPDQNKNLMHVIVPKDLLHANLHILDAQGRVWVDTTAEKIQIEIDVSLWPPGSYFLFLFNQLRLCQGTFNKL